MGLCRSAMGLGGDRNSYVFGSKGPAYNAPTAEMGTASRFASASSDAPGPCSYLGSSSTTTAAAKQSYGGFGGKTPRLRASATGTPGPGNYTVRDSFSKSTGHSGVISARSPRMPSAATESLGPGAYHQNKPTIRPSSAAFGSKSSRFSSNTSGTPGPGEYTRPQSSTTRQQVGFGAGSSRFKSAVTESPGPTSYTLSQSRVTQAKQSRAPRFSSAANELPGPGSYSGAARSDFDYKPRKTNWQPRN